MGCLAPSRCSTQPWFLRWLRSWRRFTASALPCSPVVFERRLDLDVLPGYILALEILLRILSPSFEHHVDGILEILPRFFLRPALGDRAGDLRARGDDPAVLSVLVDRGKSLHAQFSPCSSSTRFAGSTSSAFASFRIVEVNAGLPCSMR